jgi:hypothetical protein
LRILRLKNIIIIKKFKRMVYIYIRTIIIIIMYEQGLTKGLTKTIKENKKKKKIYKKKNINS